MSKSRSKLSKLRQAVKEGVVDHKCPRCGSLCRAEPDADSVWCPGCDKVIEVTPLV